MSEKEERLAEIQVIFDKRGEDLSEWEIGFLKSIREVVKKGYPLSPKQAKKLMAIAGGD